MSAVDPVPSARLAQLGEAYFATQHRYDPYNATLLGVADFDGLPGDPSREVSQQAARDLGALGAQVQAIDTANLTDAERVDHLLKPARHAGPAVREAATAHLTGTIRPAMVRLADRLRHDLAPLGRPDDRAGIREIPAGEAGYLGAVARHTTTTLSPDDIHRVGLAELGELGRLWSDIGREALGEPDFAVIAARLRDDPVFRFRTREEIIATAQDALDRAEAARGTCFEPYDIPACAIEEINPVDADDSALAYYRLPAADGSRPGAYCLLTTDPGQRYRYEYQALAFHESVPGHHLQLATAQTLDIPRYRRHIDTELCAFNEGLGPVRRAAGRRDRPVRPPDRPAGHAVRREIVRQRERARQTLGSRFELRRFHHAVLRRGAVPLTVLDDEIGRWITTEAAGEGSA